MKSTLLILVTGVAGRYGSTKQIESFVSRGETIIDYSIYNAMEAGFEKISFIILKAFTTLFKIIIYTSSKQDNITSWGESKIIVQKSISALVKNGIYLKQITY